MLGLRSTALADVSKFLRYTQQAVSLATGAVLTLDGAITPASMIAANVLMSRALAPADQIVSGWRTLQTARSALTRLLDLLHTPSAPKDLEATPTTPSQPVELECRKISVQLPGRAKAVLKDVNLLFPAGSLTMMMGPSGSGKSTLASVLVGGMASDRVRGQLWVNGEQRLPSQRCVPGEQVGYLPQDVELFNASVSDNIARLGPVDGTAVVAAAREAGLHEMILELPQGYETRIGEGGQRLSGGMRQRIALARALYGNPRWLVLDEPDANLDQAGEIALQQTLQAKRALGTTIVLISHRTHWLNIADRLVVLAHGEVQASGPKAGVLAALKPSSR
jgi:ATP-binding cassette subfamily C exporter for protease/lipase